MVSRRFALPIFADSRGRLSLQFVRRVPFVLHLEFSNKLRFIGFSNPIKSKTEGFLPKCFRRNRIIAEGNIIHHFAKRNIICLAEATNRNDFLP